MEMEYRSVNKMLFKCIIIIFSFELIARTATFFLIHFDYFIA